MSPRKFTAGIVLCSAGAVLASHRAFAETTTNSSPRFAVNTYDVQGNTVLNEQIVASILEKHSGTNIGVNDIVQAASDLQMEYRTRGYPTVNVTLPPQQITNGIVKIIVTEGVVTDVVVKNNRWFSTNNVLRSLPSLKTNTILAGHVFQAEVDRANANQDRQIYPQLEPGPDPNTSELVLEVKDRIPLHGRIEMNNYSTPGSPTERINSNVSYDNLWQLEHSLGLQYGFSPGSNKHYEPIYADNPFDSPKIANYSAFYRAPLVGPRAVGEEIEQNPSAFGYNEASRRFQLPPASGRPEISFYVARSTTEVVAKGPVTRVVDTALLSIDRQIINLSQTRDHSAGLRLSLPQTSENGLRSIWSLNVDYKDHIGGAFPADIFTTIATVTNQNGFPEIRKDTTVVPGLGAVQDYSYLPFGLGLEMSRNDKWGVTAGSASMVFGTARPFDNGNNFEQAGAPRGNDEFCLFRFRLSRDQQIYRRWKIAARGEAQVAAQSLVSLERFGIGGVSSVRGYREGELYGDDGFYGQLELRSPTWTRMETIDAKPTSLGVTLYAFTDYGRVYLKNPIGAVDSVDLWGAGLGFAATFSSHLESNVSVAWALENSPTRAAGTVMVLYSVSAHF